MIIYLLLLVIINHASIVWLLRIGNCLSIICFTFIWSISLLIFYPNYTFSLVVFVCIMHSYFFINCLWCVVHPFIVELSLTWIMLTYFVAADNCESCVYSVTVEDLNGFSIHILLYLLHPHMIYLLNIFVSKTIFFIWLLFGVCQVQRAEFRKNEWRYFLHYLVSLIIQLVFSLSLWNIEVSFLMMAFPIFNLV